MAQSKCPTCGIGRKPRSQNQNAYMWGVVYQLIADYTGHSTEEVHEFMKARFLPRSFVQIGKYEYEVSKSTKELTTVEMEDYLMRVRTFADQELGVFMPLPNEALEEV